MTAENSELTEVLGAEPPEAFQTLSESERGRLQESLERMKQYQEAELQRAIDDALSHIPALLRKSVRKMLFS